MMNILMSTHGVVLTKHMKKQIYLNMEETDKHRAEVKRKAAEQNKKILEDQKNKKDASNI